MNVESKKLAVLGGKPVWAKENHESFRWPIVTSDDEAAILAVLRRCGMSGTDVTMEFEKHFSEWQGVKYALGSNNGTSALHTAMYGAGLGVGDEIISPSITFWASILQVFSLGATMVFADIDPVTLCLDPNDIEHRITKRTKAIMVVHYLGHPADMDAILKIARKHKLKVIEDVSHAQGGLYKGRKVGSIGDVAGMSLMTGKSFAIGEAGILATDDREIYERSIAFGHYERFGKDIKSRKLKPLVGLPLGGYKYRMHQLSSAMGLVQLKSYDQRCAEIRRSMDYFWSLLDGVPGLRPHRPTDPNSNMGGYYAPHGHYLPEELGGLSVSRFCEAVAAEGVCACNPGCNLPLHLHPLLSEGDVYGHGKPTRTANLRRVLKQPKGSLPVSEGIGQRTLSVPWFKHYDPESIERYASAYRKVANQATTLLKTDKGNPPQLGGWNFFSATKK